MWDQRYDTAEYVYGTNPNAFLQSVATHIPRGRILSLAEGEGRNAVFLAELGCDVVAVDASGVGLEKAERLATSRGVSIRTVLCDLSEFELGTSVWDAIVSIFCHVPPALRQVLHRRVVQSLVPGGVLVLEAYTPDQIGRGTGGPPIPDLMMTLAGLRRELDGLRFDIGREIERNVTEGLYHTGAGSVVQVLARRPPLDTLTDAQGGPGKGSTS
jgi:SAM-dependent methyltransferase